MTDQILDRTVLRELEDTTGAEFVAELVETFLADAPGMIDDLAEAASEGDRERFRRAAHSIKSNAHVFGAFGLAEAARALELSDRVPDPAQDSMWRSDIDTQYARAAEALRAHLRA